MPLDGGETEKSAIAEHAWAEQHLWDEITILEQAEREDMLQIKETFCIVVADWKKSLNRDKGVATTDAIAMMLPPTSMRVFCCVCSDEGCSISVEMSASFVV